MVPTDFLRNVKLFANLPEEELINICKQAETREFPRDAFICKEGEEADSMYIIKSGIVQVFCDDGAGGRKILTHLKLGEYFGEMALLTDEPRTASIVALAETQLIKLAKDSFHKLLSTSPEVSLSIIKTLCARLSKTNLGAAKTKMHNVYSVIGPDTASGKSLFALNLALAMQKELNKDVLLYDPNVRDDKVAKLLKVEERSQIIDELVEREHISDICKYVAKAPCGLLTIIPQKDGLTDIRLKEFHTFSLMQTIMEKFEFVVVDSSSLYTKVTKEIVQNCDRIVYLISSKNISVSGLIEHFDTTRRNWKVDSDKIVFGVNHLTDDPKKESIITAQDKVKLAFEIPYAKDSALETSITSIATAQAHNILFSQTFGLFLPTFENDPAKAALANRWIESGKEEFSRILKDVQITGPVTRNNMQCNVLSGRTSKWNLNEHVVKLIDFSNRFKKEFQISGIIFSLNSQESLI